MSAWRQVGLNYINYSTIAAKMLRQSLKAEFKIDAERRGTSMIRFTKWAEGKAIKETAK